MKQPVYDPDNIFSKILAGEIPCHIVYEDERTLCFMDINPASRGHCLVLPRAQSRNLFDIQPVDLAHVMVTVKKVSLAIMQVLGADGITVRQNNEVAGGQEVFHTHIHIMPRYDGQPLSIQEGEEANHAVLATLARQIGRAIPK